MNLPGLAQRDETAPQPGGEARLQTPAHLQAHASAHQAEVAAAVDALRARGLATLDPAGFHHLQTLARRAAGLQGPARRFLDARLAGVLLQARARLAAEAAAAAAGTDALPAHADTARPRALLSPLAALVRELQALHAAPGSAAQGAVQPPRGDQSAWTAPAAELRALRAFKSTWVRLRDDQRLAQALACVPPNAGPLNSQLLVLRSLQRMRELSPGYFHRFVSHLETLQWLEQGSLLTDGGQRLEVGIAQRQGGRAAKLRPLRK